MHSIVTGYAKILRTIENFTSPQIKNSRFATSVSRTFVIPEQAHGLIASLLPGLHSSYFENSAILQLHKLKHNQFTLEYRQEAVIALFKKTKHHPVHISTKGNNSILIRRTLITPVTNSTLLVMGMKAILSLYAYISTTVDSSRIHPFMI